MKASTNEEVPLGGGDNYGGKVACGGIILFCLIWRRLHLMEALSSEGFNQGRFHLFCLIWRRLHLMEVATKGRSYLVEISSL